MQSQRRGRGPDHPPPGLQSQPGSQEVVSPVVLKAGQDDNCSLAGIFTLRSFPPQPQPVPTCLLATYPSREARSGEHSSHKRGTEAGAEPEIPDSNPILNSKRRGEGTEARTGPWRGMTPLQASCEACSQRLTKEGLTSLLPRDSAWATQL